MGSNIVKSLPLVGLTMGDPTGIGPEICLKALKNSSIQKKCRLVIYGDRKWLLYSAKKFNLTKNLINASIIDLKNYSPSSYRYTGAPSSLSGKASGDYVFSALADIQKKMIDALVTCPINKWAFYKSGWGKKYIGHTEMCAKLARVKSYALMMVLGSFRVVHVTSHIPLKAVYKYISSGNVFKIIELTSNSLKKMGIRKPQIAVCGLNPHAGDKGILGTEEKYISMAIKMANKKKINATGPLAADFLWPQVVSGKFDVGIAMYHDQGQIPIKLLGTKITKTGQWNVQGVNVTLGLPFIRTSVAHGTAHDIAGKNKASETSLVNAIHTALQMISC